MQIKSCRYQPWLWATVQLVILFFARPLFGQIDLSTPRSGHAATLLTSGRVLITGGVDASGNSLASAEVYDPVTKTTTVVGAMAFARAHHTSTLLTDGKVLIAGGDENGTPLDSAEIFHPTTGLFTTTRPMHRPHTEHTATLLSDGNVLIVGGKVAEIWDATQFKFEVTTGAPVAARKDHASVLLNDGTVLITGGYVDNTPQATAEIFTPTSQTFALLKSTMTIPRVLHAVTLISKGDVVITGGFSGTSPHDQIDIYDHVNQQFVAGGHMVYHRASHRQVLFGNSKDRILIMGGTTLEGGILSANELYDPETHHSGIHGSLVENRAGHTATKLKSDDVFVAGGVTGGRTLQTAEILDPTNQTFTAINQMKHPRALHTATLLPDQRVLLVGGGNNAVFEPTAEEFDPTTNSFRRVGSLAIGRESHTASLLQNGRVLVAGGKTATGDTATAEIFDPTSLIFHHVPPMHDPRSLFPAVLLQSGQVVLIGGRDDFTELNAAELFTYPPDRFTPATGSMATKRKRHTGTLLQSGDVLVAGGAVLDNGQGGASHRGTNTAELYNTSTETFSAVGNMNQTREDGAAVLLNDGTVLVTGGNNDPGPQDLYNPNTQTFSPVGELVEVRSRQTMAFLNSAWGALAGQVLVFGGSQHGTGIFGGLFQAIASVEIYNPATQSFSEFGDMTEARWGQTTTQLPDGRILITGGTAGVAVTNTAEVVKASP
jgi:Galactose oxidase, central domain